MINDNHDPLVTALADLAIEPPAGLLDRVITRWVRGPGLVGQLYVASTESGIAYVRISDAVGDSDAEFAAGFHQAVLRATATIPRGQVRPYRWIAEQVGRPGAVGAVGSALERNPVPVLIGCHRVIRSDGTVGDYVFGTATKARLLAVEGVNLAEVRDLARRGVRYLASDTTGVVCFPSGSHASRITPGHRQGFASVAAAQLAGHRPGRHCRPAALEMSS